MTFYANREQLPEMASAVLSIKNGLYLESEAAGHDRCFIGKENIWMKAAERAV